MVKSIIIVGLGGMIGSIARYLAVLWLTRDGSHFPFGTFAVNIAGCLAVGLLAGLLERYDLAEEWRSFLVIGICAGFTTFSAFAIENVRLLQEREYLTFVLYTGLSFVLGLLATVAGLWITHK